MLRLCGFALLAATFGLSTPAAAQNWPSHPIKAYIPFSAGSATDIIPRAVFDELSKVLGQTIVVENRGGAGGTLGVGAVVKAEPDGYTILVGAIGPLTIIPAAKPVSFDVAKDVVPLATVWRSAQVLAVRPGLGVKTMGEFVAYAKANPSKLTVGSAGVGAVTHLAIELTKREAGIDLVHIPFRSTSESLPQLLSGQIDALFGDASIIAPQVRSGNIVALATAGRTRARALPDVVTMAEAGYGGIEAESWFGLVVSARTPAPIVARLQGAVNAAQRDTAYLDSLSRQGASAGEPGAASFAELIRKDAGKWKAVIAATGIKIE